MWTTPRSLPPDWAARRSTVARLHDYRCAICARDTTDYDVPDGETDHVGDRDDHRIRSLRWLCAACHASRTAAQAATGRHGRICQQCAAEMPQRPPKRGRPPVWCSPACRRAARTAHERASHNARAEWATAEQAAALAGMAAIAAVRQIEAEYAHVMDRAHTARRLLSARYTSAWLAAEQDAARQAALRHDAANAARAEAASSRRRG
ncbi:hypothetical protein DFJ67_3850 [Asanoa ferruginea]|uniref:HNH endonuclease n=1 Tax=Asanoa ferruginea TaxID=53367 RepID=A0A3D9ZPH1_9ACTN|nr:hypothetical protein [Asanoa ferruginea]REF97843.1 hypothetical protein DFJ67_3850 [Asanoa ferruginea]GIF52985.1 hypothetical protein Afe04nite_75240 [Asanoa ferruginea]